MRRVGALLFGLWLAMLLPAAAAAHDDPIVTIRILCNGFNVLDMDAVLGEISDGATLMVDRPVSGSRQIETWVKDQMDHDLRIQIVDIGVPQRLPDGYTLSWTARFSRADWRTAGAASRLATNTVTIHNGRITRWNAALDAEAAPALPGVAVSGVGPPPPEPTTPPGIPDVLGIPLTLLVAAGAVLLSVLVVLRRLLR
jgi:hypothetical protein